MNLAPKTAVVIRGGVETEIPVDQVMKGDCFAVRPGDSIPVDGIVLEGVSAVNESALTGESIPVDKAAGDSVSAATINQSGYLKCEATRVGEDTTLSRIIRMVSDAAATKAPIAKVADRVSGVFVPVVLGIAAVTVLVWLLCGKEIGYALARGISVLVISCPCALGLATPVAIMVGSGVGARNGILFKTAVSLEEAGKADYIVLDKTGTVTAGEPEVTDLLPAGGISGEKLLASAATLEQYSEHPLAKAVMAEAVLPGNGVTGQSENTVLTGGSLQFIRSRYSLPEGLSGQADFLSDQGKTPLLFMRGDTVLGIIAVADVVREDSPRAVRELQQMGLRVVMLTGDNQRTAAAVGAQAGVDAVVAGVLPDGKERVVRELRRYGRVAMVGDGINDAPALTRADVGIAVGAGTDIAIDAADIVLMKSRLSDVAASVRLSRATLRNIHENLFWAFIYNMIGIPLAAGVFIPLFGWTLNPMFGAAAMSLSSFCVVSNALRLNWFRLHDASAGPRRKVPAVLPDLDAFTQEGNGGNPESEWTCRMRIEGMMCEHCEATVKKALESVEGVTGAEADHVTGMAVVKGTGGIPEEKMRQAVEAEDYTVLSVE